MTSKCSPFMYGIAGLALVTLIFHLVGFITPGWLVMKRTITEPPRHIGGHFMENDIFSRGELISRDESTDEEIREKRMSGHHPHHGRPDHTGGPHGHPSHHGPDRPDHGGRPHGRPHHRPEDSSDSDSMESDSSKVSDKFHEKPEEFTDAKDDFDEEMLAEKEHIIEWMRMKKDEMQGAEIQTNYGLWYSKVCVSPVQKKMRRKRDFHGKHEAHDKDDHKQVQCKKISTHCALYYSYIYETQQHVKKDVRTMDHKKFAFASLTEHRVEACIALAFMVLGLVTTLLGYRDIQRFKCVVYVSIACMLLAAFITTVPVSRFARYSVHKDMEKFPVYVHIPYSVISSALAAFLALCTALVSIVVLCMNTRKVNGANWRKFENDQQPEMKKENLVFYNEQLPAKPGLYDVCDFSNIKPVEEQTMDLAEQKEADI